MRTRSTDMHRIGGCSLGKTNSADQSNADVGAGDTPSRSPRGFHGEFPLVCCDSCSATFRSSMGCRAICYKTNENIGTTQIDARCGDSAYQVGAIYMRMYVSCWAC